MQIVSILLVLLVGILVFWGDFFVGFCLDGVFCGGGVVKKN